VLPDADAGVRRAEVDADGGTFNLSHDVFSLGRKWGTGGVATCGRDGKSDARDGRDVCVFEAAAATACGGEFFTVCDSSIPPISIRSFVVEASRRPVRRRIDTPGETTPPRSNPRDG
jgi:hypothetical protein